MTEFFVGISAGIFVSLFNRFILSGYIWRMCDHEHTDEHDDISSQSSAISTDVHIHHT